MKKIIFYSSLLIILLTLIIWGISVFIQPILPPSINTWGIIFFLAFNSVISAASGFKDVMELIQSFSQEKGKTSEITTIDEQKTPHFDLQFGDVDLRERKGEKITVERTVLVAPEMSEILATPRNRSTSAKYCRDLGVYLANRSCLASTGFTITNTSRLLAQNVWMEITYTGKDMVFFENEYIPQKPYRNQSEWSIDYIMTDRNRIPESESNPHYVKVEQVGEKTFIKASFGNIQPKVCVYSSKFKFALLKSGQTQLNARLFGDNIPEPIEVTLTIDALVESQKLPVSELIEKASRKL